MMNATDSHQSEETAHPRLNLGYLVPEFPGQTHIFFWRELQALHELGIKTSVISTRLPPARLISHSWSDEAKKSTTYLFPPTFGGLLSSVGELIRGGPGSWALLTRTVFSSKRRVFTTKLVLSAARLRHIARLKEITHLHVHSCGNSALLALLCRQMGGPSYSLTLHGPLGDYGQDQTEKWAYAAFCIVITRKLLTEVTEILGSKIATKTAIAPMGVDISRFRRPSEFVPWSGSGALKLFCCARLSPIKGHAELIQAVQILKKSGLEVTLRIAGEDDAGGTGYRHALEKLIRDAGVVDSVALLGAVDEETIIREHHAAHLFVLASHHEPLGVAIMEAMAAGVPVVSTNAGGVTELISDGIDGVLVSPKSPEKLAKVIAELANDSLRSQKISEAALERVGKYFHSGVSAEMLMRCLEKSLP